MSNLLSLVLLIVFSILEFVGAYYTYHYYGVGDISRATYFLILMYGSSMEGYRRAKHIAENN